MSNDDSSGKDDAFSAGVAPMLAFFASALNRNWATLSSLSEFPQAGTETGEKTEASGGWADIVNMQMRSMASSWKMFGDAMQGVFDAASQGQDKAAAHISQSIAPALRSVAGLDQNDILAGVQRDWSPKQVAFRTFGLGDSDALAMSAEMVQLAAASGATARAALSLYRVVSDAWLRAARVFSEVYPGRVPADPVELQRAWAATAEPILQETLRSEAFVKGHAEFLRAMSRQAKARSSLAKRFTDFIEAPHRQEMNETYEVIQELRREVRTLKRKQKCLEKALAAAAAVRKDVE